MKECSCFYKTPLFEERGTTNPCSCLFNAFSSESKLIEIIMFLGWWRVLRHELIGKTQLVGISMIFNLYIHRPTVPNN